MDISSPVAVKGCGRLLEPSDEIAAQWENWRGQTELLEKKLGDVFSTDFEAFRCGYDWYSQSYGNIFILCASCSARVGWR